MDFATVLDVALLIGSPVAFLSLIYTLWRKRKEDNRAEENDRRWEKNDERWNDLESRLSRKEELRELEVYLRGLEQRLENIHQIFTSPQSPGHLQNGFQTFVGGLIANRALDNEVVEISVVEFYSIPLTGVEAQPSIDLYEGNYETKRRLYNGKGANEDLKIGKTVVIELKIENPAEGTRTSYVALLNRLTAAG